MLIIDKMEVRVMVDLRLLVFKMFDICFDFMVDVVGILLFIC